MDKKFIVPFDTARQLRENGYPQEGATMYYDTFSRVEISLITDRGCVSCVVEGNDRHPLFKRLSELYIAAPIYHEVLYWLEKKGIYITCYAPLSKPVERYAISVFNSNTNNINDWGLCRDAYPTREQALNEAILKALEMI